MNDIIHKLRIPEIFKKKLTAVAEILIENEEELSMQELWLFGSLARGTYNQTSDIDLMVISDKPHRKVSLYVEELDVRDDINVPFVDVVVRSYESINSPEYLFNDLVNNDKIVLWRRFDGK